MLATLDPRQARPDPVPARRPDEGGDPRGGAARGARRRRPRREPGGVLPRRRRLPRRSSSATASPPRAGRSWTRTGASSAATTASGASRRASAAASASPPARPLYALRSEPRTNTVVVGPREALARHTRRGPRPPPRPGRARRGEAPPPRARRCRPPSSRPATRLPPAASRARSRRRAGPGRRPLRGRRGRRRRTNRRRDVRSTADAASPPSPGATSGSSRSPCSCSRVGLGLAYALLMLGELFGGTAALSGERRTSAPVIGKLGGTVDRVNVQLHKVEAITDSAVDAAEAVDGGRPRTLARRDHAGAEDREPRRRRSRYGAVVAAREPELERGGRGRQGRGRPA